MNDIGLEAILIMDKAGIPVLFQKLDPKRADIEPILLSGFLTAIKEFSTTLIDDMAQNFNVDYGKRVITILSGHKIIFAAIHNKKTPEKIVSTLSPLLKEFEETFYSDVHVGEPGPLNQYYPFKERIATVMGISNVSLDWMPFATTDEPGNLKSNFDIPFELLDGTHSISELASMVALREEELIQGLSQLWAFGEIDFRNVLAKSDIVISTQKVSLYLQPNSAEWKQVAEKFPNVVQQIPYIVSHLDGKTTVGKILEDFVEEGIENIFWLMDYLLINGAIAILTPEKRRILMAKEILAKSLSVAEQIHSKNIIVQKLKDALKQISKPEIISQIRLLEDSWQIDYSFLVYEGLTPEKVLQLYEVWLEVLRLFIFTLMGNERKTYLELLTQELDYAFFEKYNSEDMDGFEEFAFWLETMFI